MKNRSLRRLLPALLFVILFAASAFAAGEPPLRVTFLNVGQGDAILVRTADKTILVDAGDDKADAANSSIIPYFKKEGIKKIDLAVISHPHRDHFGGFLQLVQSVPIEEFLYSSDSMGAGDPEESSSDALLYAKLHDAIVEKGIKYTQARMGEKLEWGKGVTVEVLHAEDKSALSRSVRLPSVSEIYPPTEAPTRGASDTVKISANEQSLIIKLTVGKISYLLTGDAERGAESIAISAFRDKLNCTVLKSGHHGSKTSSGNPFLDLARPEYGVISVAAKNSFGHPNKETLDKYAFYKMKVFRTDQDGHVDSWTDGKEVHFNSNQSPLEFAKKPEIISLTPNSATVQWVTNKPSDTRIYYGIGSLAKSKIVAHAVTIHTVTLTDLEPSSAYTFRVMSQDARVSDQVVTSDGALTTPAGNGIPLPRIDTFTYTPKEIFVRRPFKTRVKISNPGAEETKNLSIVLYHTAMSPDNILGQTKISRLKATDSTSIEFPVEITWMGQVELLAVLLKGKTIVDTESISLDVQPKIIYIDCGHGNIEYYTGKFGGMKMDLFTAHGFQLRSASKQLTSIDQIAESFIYIIPEPRGAFDATELAILKEYVAKGGSVMLYGRSDYGNKSTPEIQNAILEAIGSKIRFNDDQFCDPTNNIGAPWRAWVQNFPAALITGVSNVLVRNCCSLIAKGNKGLAAGAGIEILATGDDDSFNQNADNLDDGYIYASHTPKLAVPIAAAEDLGTGRVACFGENLYDDSQYQPNAQIHTPQLNRCVTKWLSVAREKSLRQLLQFVDQLSAETDPEARAVRFEALRDRVTGLVRDALENGDASYVRDAFTGYNSQPVQELRRSVKDQLEFRTLHGEDRIAPELLRSF
ncbi:MAG TPA: MBL fold metallo-hydrolase [Candidatus Ozemobacteraceae bacterium]|nr:MBL fold metallo-hydrolase [Candidatus Ozemobacteraceae bacterium]